MSKKLIIFDLVIIFVLSLVPLFWFPKGYMVTGHDSAYPLNVLGHFQEIFYTWRAGEIFGYDYSHNMGSILLYSIQAFFVFLGFSIADSQKLNFIFWFFTMGVSMYYFANSLKKILDYRYLPLVASVFYIFNFYLLALWRLGAGSTFAAYGLLPLIASFVIRFLLYDLSPVKAGLLSALAFFFLNGGGGFSVPLYGGLFVVILTALIYFTALSVKEKKKQILRRYAFFLVTFLLCTLALNSYWLLPFLSYVFTNFATNVAGSGGVSGAKSWTDSVSATTSLTNLFRLQGFPDWYENVNHAYSQAFLKNPLLILVSLLFVPLSFASIFLAKNKKEKMILLFFGLSALLALFFSAGTHKPTGFLFGWLMDYVPGFVIFRSAQYKFIPALYFSLAIPFAYTISKLIKPKLGILLVIAGLVIYHYPFFSRSFFDWNKPLTLLVKVPDYIHSFDQWSSKNLNPEQRILLLPRLNTSWRTEVYDWKYFSILSALNLLTPLSVVQNQNTAGEGQISLINRFYDEILNRGPLVGRMASIFQTPVALLRGDFFYKLDWVLSEDPQIYQKALENSGYPVLWQEGKWSVYQLPVNPSEIKKIYQFDKITKFVGPEHSLIGAIVAGSNNYVHSDDANKILEEKFNDRNLLSGNIFYFPCSSCFLESPVQQMELPAIRILPGSLFYLFKEQSEDKLLANKDQNTLLGDLLGLTAKRTSEINNLSILQRKEKLITETGQRLLSYWQKIREIISEKEKEGISLDEYRIIESYVKPEIKILKDKYNSDENLMYELRRIIGLNLELLEEINARLEQKLYSTNWDTIKEFRVTESSGSGELFIDLYSLKKNLQGKYIFPEEIELGSNVRQKLDNMRILDEKVSLGTFDLRGLKNIKLLFPDPDNLAINTKITKSNFPKWNNNCLRSEIGNYSWQKKYRIGVRFNQAPPKDFLAYVRISREIYNQDDPAKAGFSRPPYIFYPDTQPAVLSRWQYFTFQGKDGDRGGFVFLCTSEDRPINTFLQDFTITTLEDPALYFIPSEASLINAQPAPIEYQRINSTKYVVRLKNSAVPTVLVFNEAFNPKWYLYYPNSSDPVFSQNHFPILNFANAWLIDQPVEQELILEFGPQKLFYQGAIVSGLALIFVITVLVLGRRRSV